MQTNDITQIVIDESFSLHSDLGPGLLESVYEKILFRILTEKGLAVKSQVPVSFSYRGVNIENGFKIDLLIEEKVILELKSVEKLQKMHYKQLLTYLRLMNMEVGLLINFGEASLKNGIKRIVNGFRNK